jgi:hypothetical protein
LLIIKADERTDELFSAAKKIEKHHRVGSYLIGAKRRDGN